MKREYLENGPSRPPKGPSSSEEHKLTVRLSPAELSVHQIMSQGTIVSAADSGGSWSHRQSEPTPVARPKSHRQDRDSHPDGLDSSAQVLGPRLLCGLRQRSQGRWGKPGSVLVRRPLEGGRDDGSSCSWARRWAHSTRRRW